MRRAILAALALAAPAAAQPANDRARAVFDQADAAMNRQWRITLSGMKRRDAADPRRRGAWGYAGRLLASQRTWLAYLAEQCTIEGLKFPDGPPHDLASTRCRTRLTGERTTLLKQLDWR